MNRWGEKMKIVTKADIVASLQEIGLKEGNTVIVHTSLSSIGYVCGGAQTVIEALIEVVGENGTIMMPTQSWKNLDPEAGVHWDVSEQDWDTIRENWPAYDKKITPTNTGASRSDHPARSVAAWGRHSVYLTEKHDLSDIFGDDSPIGRLYELDGKVLLIGVGYNKNTSIHLADVRADYPGKHISTEHSAVTENGKRVWKAYDTLFVDGEDFEEIGRAFEEEHEVKILRIGEAETRLMRQRDLVDFAVKWIEEYRK